MKIDVIEKSFKPTKDGKCATAKHGMVASAFPDATKAGVKMLKKGGNAVDAACATALAIGVCEPAGSGIGGQGMAILHINGKTVSVDGSSRAPSLATHSAFRRKIDASIGYKATTVPSTPALLGYLVDNYGKLSWADISKPSIRIAKKGYRITQLQHNLQKKKLDQFMKVKSRSGARYFLKNGKVPYDVGDRFVQDDLGEMLKEMSSNGYKSFYYGNIAKMIDSDMKKNKGLLRAEDLAMMPKAIERKPIGRKYRNVVVVSPPPPSAGRTTLLVLMMLNNLRTKFLRTQSPETFHFLAETFRKALIHRTQRPFDPATYHQIKDKEHLSKIFARKLAKSIRTRIDPSLPFREPPKAPSDTTHLSVMDDEGNCAGITQSIEGVYASKAAAEGLGFIYNNYMSAFELKYPHHPYYLRPNSIPWTSVSPSIVFHKRQPWMVVGSPGSERIFSTITYFLSRVIDCNLSMCKAINMPRLHCSIGGKISYENGFDKKAAAHLKKMGYKTRRLPRHSYYLGAIHAVIKNQTSEGFQGVAEVRRDGTAEGL